MQTRRRSALGAALLGVTLLTGFTALTACSAGQMTQTDDEVASVPGVNANSADGGISLRNGMVVYAAKYQPNTALPLDLRLFNNSGRAAKLTGAVTADGTGKVVLVGGPTASAPPPPLPAPTTPSGSPSGSASPSESPTPAPSPTGLGSSTFNIEVPQDGLQALAPEGTGGYLAITGRSGALTPGNTVGVTFTFTYDNGSTTTLSADLPVGIPLSPLARSTPAPPSAG